MTKTGESTESGAVTQANPRDSRMVGQPVPVSKARQYFQGRHVDVAVV